MAWQIDQAIVRGEIDNTIPGQTLGRIWLIHQAAPLEMILQGDCWRDLAGTVLRFTNPAPEFSLAAPELSSPQRGLVGDMTASRKLRVYPADSDAASSTWRNHLSLEWFDNVNGRVLIETPLFELELSDRHWSMSPDEEEQQIRRNLEVMREFMQVFLQRDENSDLWSQENADEFAWEKRFRESDRLSDAFQELMEKYGDDADCQKKIAYAMGWSDTLTDENTLEESATDVDWEREMLLDELIEEENTDGWRAKEWDQAWDGEDDEFWVHPLQQKAQDCAAWAMEHLGEKMDRPGAEGRLCSLLMMIAAKLAGTLNGSRGGDEQEPGFVLAMLKRCLYWQNDAISACAELESRCDDPDEQKLLQQIRQSIFEIREQITELRREFKQN
jgi:hypothetical protein